MSDELNALWRQAWGAAGNGKLQDAQSFLSQMEDTKMAETAALQEQMDAIRMRINIGNAIRATFSRMRREET